MFSTKQKIIIIIWIACSWDGSKKWRINNFPIVPFFWGKQTSWSSLFITTHWQRKKRKKIECLYINNSNIHPTFKTPGAKYLNVVCLLWFCACVRAKGVLLLFFFIFLKKETSMMFLLSIRYKYYYYDGILWGIKLELQLNKHTFERFIKLY